MTHVKQEMESYKILKTTKGRKGMEHIIRMKNKGNT